MASSAASSTDMSSLVFSPKVSVIIPCFNGSKTLGRAIESVLAQTTKELELIIVDDGSTDDSLKVVERYIRDARVILLKNDSNLGISATKNAAIRAARGEYVAFLDQDDVWNEDKLEQQLMLFDDPDVYFAYCSVIWRDDSDHFMGRFKFPTPESGEQSRRLISISSANSEILLAFPIPSASTVIVRRSFLDEYGLLNEKLYSGDEIELCSRVINKHKVVYDDEPLVCKTVHSGCASNNIDRMREARLMLLDEVVANQPKLRRHENRRRAEIHYQNGLECFRLGRRAQARGDFLKSIRNCSLRLRYYLAFALTFDPSGVSASVARKIKAALERFVDTRA
jgi:glycosyltransferase involved in cell wall biosynthesis